MKTEERRAFIINFLYYAIWLAIAFVILRYGLPMLTPFVAAFVICVPVEYAHLLCGEQAAPATEGYGDFGGAPVLLHRRFPDRPAVYQAVFQRESAFFKFTGDLQPLH